MEFIKCWNPNCREIYRSEDFKYEEVGIQCEKCGGTVVSSDNKVMRTTKPRKIMNKKEPKGIKVLSTWCQEERWSAYNTDVLYYAEVLIDGEKQIFKDYNYFNPVDRAMKYAERIRKEKKLKHRRELLLNKRKNEELTKEEALELVNLLL